MKIINIILGESDEFLRGPEAVQQLVKTKKEIAIVPEIFRDDVDALAGYICNANFKSGLRIELSLSELLSVVPRNRRRVDAYNEPVKYLKNEHDIKLIIITNRK